MGWAVIQTVDPYHPQGDTTRPKTTEFVHWIFDTKEDADAHKADLLLTKSATFAVRKVEEDAWVSTLSAKKEKKEKQ